MESKNDKNESKAQKYIEQHNLEHIMAEMLNTLVFEKARKPEIFMIKYLSNLLSVEERLRFGIHVPENNLPVAKPIVKYPSNSKNKFLKNNLTKELWGNIKYNRTEFGATISEVLENDEVALVDADVILVFNQ
jgi:hypothetical protein